MKHDAMARCDLTVKLRVEGVPRLESGLAAQLKQATDVGGPGALAVVRMEVAPGAPVLLFVCEPKGNRVFARDLAMTLEGHIDRHAIPTRRADPAKGLVLQDASRPTTEPAWLEARNDEVRPRG